MIAATLHNECDRCRRCLEEAETMAQATGSRGSTMVFDDRLVTGEYHAAKWSRDPEAVAFLAPPNPFDCPPLRRDRATYWPIEDPQHDGAERNTPR